MMTQPVSKPDTPKESYGALTIVGFILSFFIPLVGLVLSILAWKQSSDEGRNNKLARAGIIVAIVFLILNVIAWIAVRHYGLPTEFLPAGM